MELSNRKIEFSGLFSFCLFLLIWPMFVGPYIALTNPSFFGGPEVTNLTLSSALYVARNLAIGFAFLLAIYLKNASMLFILIVVRLITDLIDAPLFYIYREPVLIGQIIIFTFLCYLPAVFGLRYLWKKINYK
jgi:hypothetical protein